MRPFGDLYTRTYGANGEYYFSFVGCYVILALINIDQCFAYMSLRTLSCLP